MQLLRPVSIVEARVISSLPSVLLRGYQYRQKAVTVRQPHAYRVATYSRYCIYICFPLSTVPYTSHRAQALALALGLRV